MQLQTTWLKPGIWGVVIGGILTMILGFGWGGWTTSRTGNDLAVRRADAAVTAVLVPICLAKQKVDGDNTKKLAELKAMTSSYQQTEFVMKTGWATFPGKDDPHRDVAEACATALVETAAAK